MTAQAVWLHNGHLYQPGQDIDNPHMADPRWCNTCGEEARCLYDAGLPTEAQVSS